MTSGMRDLISRKSPVSTWCAIAVSITFFTLYLSRFKQYPLLENGVELSDPQRRLLVWRSTLFMRTINVYKEIEKITGGQMEPVGHHRFDLLSPIVSCPGNGMLKRVGGSDDGGKLICLELLDGDSCVVYSLGGNNNYQFEEDILASTRCNIITLDCSVDGWSVDGGKRHVFLKKCLGKEERMEEDPQNWITLDAAMTHFGHNRLDLLKIDIEGYEYDVFSSWKIDAINFPMQIAMELHYKDIYFGTPSFNNSTDLSNLFWPKHQITLSELSLFMLHLSNMGYAIVSREDNKYCSHCSEVTLLKV